MKSLEAHPKHKLAFSVFSKFSDLRELFATLWHAVIKYWAEIVQFQQMCMYGSSQFSELFFVISC